MHTARVVRHGNPFISRAFLTVHSIALANRSDSKQSQSYELLAELHLERMGRRAEKLK
jgi:hypothetical protein